MFASLPRVLVSALAGLAAVVGVVVLLALLLAEERRPYELVKDLVLPLIGPVVAVLVPTLLLYVIPRNQSRERFALDLCAQYYTEEMRHARNVGWELFVTSQHRETPARQVERLNDFLDYVTNPDAHRAIDPRQDEVYQKATRILDFFALVDASLLRGAADPDIVRSVPAVLLPVVAGRDPGAAAGDAAGEHGRPQAEAAVVGADDPVGRAGEVRCANSRGEVIGGSLRFRDGRDHQPRVLVRTGRTAGFPLVVPLA